MADANGRLQEGGDVEDLLAELDEELPSDDEEEEEDEEDAYLTEVQKKTRKTERLFSEDTKKHKKDEATRRELQTLRNRLNCGGTSNRMDDFDDLLNADFTFKIFVCFIQTFYLHYTLWI